MKTLPHGAELTSGLVMLRRAKDRAVTARTGKAGDELSELVRRMLDENEV